MISHNTAYSSTKSQFQLTFQRNRESLHTLLLGKLKIKYLQPLLEKHEWGIYKDDVWEAMTGQLE